MYCIYCMCRLSCSYCTLQYVLNLKMRLFFMFIHKFTMNNLMILLGFNICTEHCVPFDCVLKIYLKNNLKQCCGARSGSGTIGSASSCRIRIHNIFHGSRSRSLTPTPSSIIPHPYPPSYGEVQALFISQE